MFSVLLKCTLLGESVCYGLITLDPGKDTASLSAEYVLFQDLGDWTAWVTVESGELNVEADCRDHDGEVAYNSSGRAM